MVTARHISACIKMAGNVSELVATTPRLMDRRKDIQKVPTHQNMKGLHKRTAQDMDITSSRE